MSQLREPKLKNPEEQSEKNPEEDASLHEPRDSSAPVSTIADFQEAYGESPEAIIERLLSPDINLLAFSHVLFAHQVITFLELLTKLNTNDDDSQELAIRSVKEAHQIGYNAIKDSFKLASPNFYLLEERKLQQANKDQDLKLAEIRQFLPTVEQKLKEVENRVAVL